MTVEASVLADPAPAPPYSAAEPAPIERRSGLDLAQFQREYLAARVPVILTDAAAAWPLYTKATPDFFRREFGAREVEVKGTRWRLDALLDELERSTPERPGPYPCKFDIARTFPELLPQVAPRPAYSLPDRQAHPLLPRRLFTYVNNLEIFFGGPGGEFPYLHYDLLRLHAWITQLHGDKEFTVYAPDQEPYLYVNPDLPWQSSIRDHHHPDFEKYPLFRHARARKVVVRAGETLFLPCGWWHTARSLNTTISVAFDQLGPGNWSDFVGDIVAEKRREGRGARALLVGAYLRAIDPLLRIVEAFGGNRARRWGGR